MTEAQELKLDEVLKLTARHGAHLGVLTAQYQRLADKQDVLSQDVTVLKASKDESTKRTTRRLTLLAIGVSVISALTAVTQAFK